MTDLPAVEAVFSAALALTDPDLRRAYLDRACQDDPGLRSAVERLLAAHEDLGDFLEPVRTIPDELAGGLGPTALGSGFGPGSLLAGRYELLEPIGEGGMGTVWTARQIEPVCRIVAVKLIKAGMAGRQVLARFESERQALAVMDHPNIAKILDGGETPDGRPFLVMERVEGVPITRFCDERRLTLRERLALFDPVCRAIQHAHQKGVIHRDIKPNNVLVALYDGRAEPKVIDFGVAKTAEQTLIDETLATGFGSMVGTPEYMSPEQAAFRNRDVDTRSDVYALGVLLYELLAGSPPISRVDPGRSGLLEFLRVVREEEPPSPSRRLSNPDTLPGLAAARGIAPNRVVALVRGELDWIAMKALEKDRTRRYESAGGLATDIQRYLAGESVLAAPPRFGYRFRKLLRRHRAPVAASALVFLALIAGGVGTTWGLLRAERERAKAIGAAVDEARAHREIALGEAELAMDQGRALCEQGELGQGMLWLSCSLRLAIEARDIGLERAARVNLAEWWARLGRPLARLKARSPAEELAFRPDGSALVARGEDGAPQSWEAGSWRGLAPTSIVGGTRPPGGGVGTATALSRDGSTLVVGGEDGTVVYRDARSGRPLGPPLPLGSPVLKVAFLGDDHRVVAMTGDGRVHSWDGSSRIAALPPEGTAVACLAVSPGGDRLATGTEGGTVRLWDAATLRLGGPTFKLDVAVRSLAFRPDGRALAVGLEDGSIPIWEVPPSGPIAPPRPALGPVRALAFSRDGEHLLVVGDGGHERWHSDRGAEEARTKDCRWTREVHRSSSVARGAKGVATASPDGRLVASANESTPNGHGIQLLDAETGAVVGEHDDSDGPIEGLAFSPDSRFLLSWRAGPGTASLLPVGRPGSARPLARALGVAVQHAAFSPDGTVVLLGCRDGKARLWDLARDVEVEATTRPYHVYPITAVAFEPRGPRMVTGCHAGTVRFWDRASGALLCDVRGNAGEVTAVAFSPDGATLLTASLDASARFWDVATGRQLGPALCHTDAVLSVTFHPDGRSVATGTRDGAVWRWRVPAAPMQGDPESIDRRIAPCVRGFAEHPIGQGPRRRALASQGRDRREANASP